MVKPIDLDELVLRVGALLRRANIAKERQVLAGDLVMDANAMTAQRFRLFSKPMRKLSTAAQHVANGDFSVTIEPIHPVDKKDYVDVMFDDFNTMVKELGSIEIMKK